MIFEELLEIQAKRQHHAVYFPLKKSRRKQFFWGMKARMILENLSKCILKLKLYKRHPEMSHSYVESNQKK